MYIVFEGVIGTGKTTQSKNYTSYLQTKYPEKQITWTREPGGTEISDAIRKIVQGTKFSEEMDPICEAYLYAASRAQSLRSVVKPVLDSGGIVVSDRSFLTSLTNQAFGRNIGFDKVMEINKVAVENFMPDKIVFLDLPIKIGIERSFDKDGDKFESLGEEFYQRVYEGYKKVQKMGLLTSRWVNIDAEGSMDEVLSRIITTLSL